jgi:hypothetical protein
MGTWLVAARDATLWSVHAAGHPVPTCGEAKADGVASPTTTVAPTRATTANPAEIVVLNM